MAIAIAMTHAQVIAAHDFRKFPSRSGRFMPANHDNHITHRVRRRVLRLHPSNAMRGALLAARALRGRGP